MGKQKNQQETKQQEKNPRTENRKERKKRKITGFDVFRLIAGILCLCIAIGCIYYLGNYFLKSKHSQDQVQNLKQLISEEASDSAEKTAQDKQQPEYVTVNGRLVQKKFAALYEANPDFIGWLTIPDTRVDYPVMQHPGDNEYYIHRNFEEEWDGSGLLFLDLRSNYMLPTDNLLIYGHNMKTGTMLADILKYESEEYYQEHKYLTFDTLDGDEEYEVIAAFYSQIYPEEDTEHFKYYEFFDAASEEEFNTYIEQIRSLTPYEINAEATYGDTLITLSTCAYNTQDGRFALVARKISAD